MLEVAVEIAREWLLSGAPASAMRPHETLFEEDISFAETELGRKLTESEIRDLRDLVSHVLATDDALYEECRPKSATSETDFVDLGF